MENHYFDANGVYTHSAPANPGSLPPSNALRREPPKREGWWPVLDAAGSDWELVEDYRGRKGWLGGETVVVVAPGPLPDGWSDTPAPAADTRDIGERRRDDFALEVDPVNSLALAHHLEEEAWLLAGDKGKAEKARKKYRSELRRLLERKEAVRSRHSDLETDPGATPAEPCATEVADAEEPVRYLTRSGVYHAAGCPYTRAAGEWLKLAEILARRPGARACGKCAPGAEG